MPVKITLIVETTNHTGGGRLTFHETSTDNGGNPRYDGDTVLRDVAKLTRNVVSTLDKIVKDPIRTGSEANVGCPCVCNSGGFCGGCGHAGCGGRR